MKRLALILSLLCTLAAAPAQSVDEFYVRIYNTIKEADTLSNNLQFQPALQRYQEAASALRTLQKGNPSWNEPVVKFRLAYLDERISQLEKKVPAAAQPATAPGTSAAQAPATQQNPAVTEAMEAQMNALREQLSVMQEERGKLEAKLREALAVQPAATNPQELEKANQRIQALQKENDLLKVALDKAKATAVAPAAEAPAAAASKNLSETVAKLEVENKALRERLGQAAAPQSSDVQAALDRSEHNQAELKETILKLTAEREALQARLSAAGSDASASAALKAENALLRQQLTDAQAQAQASVKASGAATAKPDRKELKRIAELERERDSLAKKLQAATRQLEERRRSRSKAGTLEMETELAGLRQRLQSLEAQKVPYTAEELALFRAPAATIATSSADSAAPARKFSVSNAGMAAEAQKFVAAGKLDQAEEKYQAILKEDKSDVRTLANLATVQLLRNELADADKTIARALELAPQDAFSLSVLGKVRFMQKRYDDAFDALSKAAAADPKDAEVQNYLGLVLSEKGMRSAAESALRKAVQLQPDYGSAHQNLAVVYLTQSPPLVELARFHYNKSLAAGTPANPRIEQMLQERKP